MFERIPKVFEKYHQELERIEDRLGKLSKTYQVLFIWDKGIIELLETNRKIKP